jgi:hypothetical protein
MSENNDDDPGRRAMMKGIGSLAAISMSGATIPQAQATLADELPTDPHTRDTYRAIVDAIVPRTPELGDELGEEHVPGGLDIELEKFLIWDFNHFQEIRLETLTDTAGPTDGQLSADMLEVGFAPAAADSSLDALYHVSGITEDVVSGTVDELNGLLDDLLGLGGDEIDVDDLREHLDFGAVDRFEIAIADSLEDGASGPATFDAVVETANEVTHTAMQNYPYSTLFPIVFDVVATEFILLGRNEDAIERGNDQFPGGGTFVQLSREDRLRCLWTIIDGGAIDRLDELLSPLVTDLGILKFVVMAMNGLHGFGYYTEWSGYGDTKAEMPNDRQLNVPAGEVQSHQQSGYPGPQPGYAADWRHAVPDGFDDPEADEMELPDDLTGDDVVDDLGGGSR